MTLRRDDTGRVLLDGIIYASPHLSEIRPERGRRRDRCDVRIPYYPKGRHVVSGPDYAWCGEIARYRRGEQGLCLFHAGMVYAIRNLKDLDDRALEVVGLYGITADGKWK